MNIYLREMGSLTLLSHKEELKLAKLVEEGKLRVQNAVLSTPLAQPVLQEIAADLESGSRKIFQTIHGIPDNEPKIIKRELESFYELVERATGLDRDREALLERLRLPTSGQPHIVEVRMLVDDEVAGRRRRVVAGPSLIDDPVG